MKQGPVKSPLQFDAGRYGDIPLDVDFGAGRTNRERPARLAGKATKGRKIATPPAKAAHRPVVPLNAGSILPAATIYRLAGLPDYGDVRVPMMRPGDAADDEPWPRLVLRMPKKGGNRGTWVIHDHMSDVERQLLGRSDSRYRISTGCKEGEEEKAIEKLKIYLDLKRDRLLGRLLPTQILMISIFENYLSFLEDGGDGLAEGSIASYKGQLRPLIAYFGHLNLGSIDRKLCLDYAVHRRAQPVICNGANGRLVSEKQIEHELATLRRAINVFKADAHINLDVQLHVPTAPRRPCVSLRRSELARYLWACRGRIWNDEAGRWRIRRDDDPALLGPEGDQRVLRPPEIVASRASLGRLLLLGVYTGSRVGVLLKTSYDDENTAHVDWNRGVIERRGAHERETTKRRPSVLLPSKMVRFLRNWSRRDMAAGIRHPIHKADGSPYATPIAAVRWRKVDADAGCNKRMHAHAMRHTAVNFLKASGCSVWVASDFLGCSPFVLVERYGVWDVHSQREAADAIGYGKRVRETEMMAIRYVATPPKPKMH